MQLKNILLMLYICLLSGCCRSYEPSARPMSSPTVDATAQLAEAAASVSQSLGELAAIEKAAIKPARKTLPADPSYDPVLNSLVTIDWSGPIGPLVKKLAIISGYKIRTLGAPPAIPVIVTINAKDTPLNDILRDASFQAGARANIYVMTYSKTIELRYSR